MSASPNTAALKKEILDLHRSLIQAHLEKDVDSLVNGQAPDFTSIHSGEIRHPTIEETRASLTRYLNTTEFTEYRDMVEPTIGVSPDGSTAWSIVQVKVAGHRTDPNAAPVDFTCAWVTLYARRDGAWRRVVEASTFKE